MAHLFGIGSLVQLRADPTRSGAVLELLPPVLDAPRYRVFHSLDDIRVYNEDQLTSVVASQSATSPTDAPFAGRWLVAADFLARLTAARLAHPQVDHIYALHAARIRFIPFQFKPLLRFLRAERPRLLIADEVGVGKTIEAGLILKELQARQRLENVLIVCPKSLVSKWRAEMRRFDEDFRVLNSADLGYCLEQMRVEGEWPAQYSRAIAHIELLRVKEHLDGSERRPGLLKLTTSPRFGLMILDEAHHVRNPGTSSHKLLEYLCGVDVSEAVVFLSATPVHLGSRNLFELLHLLRPEDFPTKEVFSEMVLPNASINRAMRRVRNRLPAATWQIEAGAALNDAAGTTWGQRALSRDPRFSEWVEKLSSEVPLPDAERIRCLRDLEEVHTLAHVINRTRRRDIGRFTTREPHTISVAFTQEQRRFYDDLIAVQTDILRLKHGPIVARLIVDNLERQAASCLPALLPVLDRVLQTGRLLGDDLSDAADEEDEYEEGGIGVNGSILHRVEDLRHRAKALSSEDPKYDKLQEILRESMSSVGPGKVLLFSFFLHTLAYLETRIRAAGYRVAVVKGSVPEEQRESLRARFRLPRDDGEALDVLLSSEVGCEGLDYEFCDRLVNYDIPWNPMRVEQRIGRIDRFGQLSEKVLIYNFITPDTVEARIYFRCFERLGIFRDTVGDIEEVLGEVVSELNSAVLNLSLTSEQQERKAQQITDNAVRHAEELRRLEEQGGALLGLDDPYAAEIESVKADAKYVSPDDLRQMIMRLLNSPEISGRLTDDERIKGLCRLRLNREARLSLLKGIEELKRNDRSTREFCQALKSNELSFPITFDPDVALEHRNIPFITPLHPLAGVAIQRWGASQEPLAARLVVEDPQMLPGRYLFVCDLWETIAIHPGLRFVTLAWDLKKGEIAADISTNLLNLLRRSTEAEPPHFFAEDIEEGLLRVDEEADRKRRAEREMLRVRNATLIDQKLAGLGLHHANRLTPVQDSIEKSSEDKIRHMWEARRNNIERDHKTRREQIEQRKEADIISRRIAVGLLEIRNGH